VHHQMLVWMCTGVCSVLPALPGAQLCPCLLWRATLARASCACLQGVALLVMMAIMTLPALATSPLSPHLSPQPSSSFNYVNEVNTEIEKLEDQTTVIRAEIERYKDSGQELDRSKGFALRDVEDRLAATESQADLYEKRWGRAWRRVEWRRGQLPGGSALLGTGDVSRAALLLHRVRPTCTEAEGAWRLNGSLDRTLGSLTLAPRWSSTACSRSAPFAGASWPVAAQV